jgi:hypothetical protein
MPPMKEISYQIADGDRSNSRHLLRHNIRNKLLKYIVNEVAMLISARYRTKVPLKSQ